MKQAMVLGGVAALTLVGNAGAQALPHTDGMPDIVFPPQPQVQQIPLSPGLTPSYDYRQLEVTAAAPKVPEGFTPIFNGKDLTGWHTSKTARHGVTPDFRAIQGVIVGTQAPIGRGGLLITDKAYKNYEFYMEAKADWGADSGIFLRTTEEGAAYQLTLDYLPGGGMGRIIQEGGLIGVGRPVGQETAPAAPPGPPAADPGMSAWKHNEWNSVRVRVTGDNPHVTVWINDKQISDFTDPANRAVGGMTTGPIALQIHGGPHRWLPGSFWRWRNIGIKELP